MSVDTDIENGRYDRQMLLPEIGREGQLRLSRARVLMVGMGGLGSPAALYLAAAGVGCLGLMDADVVSVSNLHRQILYADSQVGRPKVEVAAEGLRRVNPALSADCYPYRLTRDNACSVLSRYDLVMDGTDNFESRYILDDACHQTRKPYIYGAVQGLEGQAAVFNAGPGSCRYRDLYPDEAATRGLPGMGKEILGMTPAVIGNVMAVQAVLLITGHEAPLANRLWTINLRTMESFTMDL